MKIFKNKIMSGVLACWPSEISGNASTWFQLPNVKEIALTESVINSEIDEEAYSAYDSRSVDSSNGEINEEKDELNLEEIINEAKKWRCLILRSELPLANEIQVDKPQGSIGEYVYHYLIRGSGRRIVLVATHSHVTENLLELAKLKETSVYPEVRIADIVEHFSCKRHRKYVLGSVFAGVIGCRQALRTVSLYGHDLADADIFQIILSRLQPYRVELRNRDLDSGIVSISSRGEISFRYHGLHTFLEVINVLKYLRESDYLKWPLAVLPF